MKLRFLFALFVVVLFSCKVSAWGGNKVILITIDGMRSEMITDPTMPSPFLKMMRNDKYSIYINNVEVVSPSMTYPTHTSIITGVLPIEHGIHCNRVFQYNRDEPVLNHLWADSIKVPTLWQWVKERGGVTASIFWPVSTGSEWIDYNVPEYYPSDRKSWHGGAMDYIRPVCTPAGLLEELEREATGRMTDATMRANSFEYDAKTAYMTNYLVNTYNPDLITVHLITTDYAQHEAGLDSDRIRQAVASSDNAVGLIIENLQYMGRLDSTTIIVCGDHGFVQGEWRLNPNVLLCDAGLLSKDLGADWRCCFSSVGAASYLYLNPSLTAKQRKNVMKQVYSLFDNQPDSVRSLYTLLDNAEIMRMGGDPNAVLCIDPVAGAGISNSRVGKWVQPFKGGYHGYMNGCTPTSILIYGAGAKYPEKFDDLINFASDSMKQTDISALIRRILGETK